AVTAPYKNLERKALFAFTRGDERELQKICLQADNDPHVTDGCRSILRAHHDYLKSEFTEAKKQALYAYKEEGENPVLLNLLSKYFIKIGDYNSALKLLKPSEDNATDPVEKLSNLANESGENSKTHMPPQKKSKTKA